MSLKPAYSTFTHRDFSANSIFKRCVQCGTSAPPCPACEDGYTCTMISQSCTACASTKCIKTSVSNPQPAPSSGGGSNAGAIAGGVIGGIAFIAIVTFLVWWFFIRKKRSIALKESNESQEKNTSRGAPQGRNSIASTVFTRASNVIQIAYIPGVTNRSPPQTPGGLVPPVPPLPGASPEQHFFMPGDLRDSSWSGMTRSSFASVATTAYRSNAIIDPLPAQQAMRTRAAVVSIHNGNNASPSATPTLKVTPPDAPAVPAITTAQLAKAGVKEIDSRPVVARTVVAKPVTVMRSASKKGPYELNSSSGGQKSNRSSAEQTPSDRKETPGTTSSGKTETVDTSSVQTTSATAARDSRTITRSPFEDQPETEIEIANDHGPAGDLRNQVSSRPRGSQLVERGESPFSDANEVK